jgi:hypothetical protein
VKFFKRTESDLERELRRHRPEPRSEFLNMLSDRLHERPRRRLGARLGAVAFATAVMLAALGAFGGMSYAATSAHEVVSAVKAVIVAPVVSGKSSEGSKKSEGDKTPSGKGEDSKGKDDGSKPDSDEYGKKVKVCHNPGRNQHTIEVSANAVPALVAHGDYVGECRR